ncbi:dihydrofolate reductase family protein [Leuconostoc lactis]|uniref:dihydrofolate reductase family protein n=1 Tax=Leuconostoc lactis TaxID=1246 RepID=UPI0031E409AB
MAACAETIRDWGLARVVIGDLDPNPTTHGLGVQKLRAAGISVVVLDTDDSRQLNPAFYQYHEQHQPYIQLKSAQSHNGYVSAVRGQRSKITDAVADLDVHRQRARHSAIIVGSETWVIDQPRLTVRDVMLTHQQPQRVVIYRRGRLAHEPATRLKDWLVYTENAQFAQQENVELMTAGLPGVMADLGRKGMQSVMVEGGPILITSFLQAQLWHECLIYTADRLLPDGVRGIVLPQLPDDIQRIGHTQRQRYVNQEVATCLQASRKSLVG